MQGLVVTHVFNTPVVTTSGKGGEQSVIICPIKNDQNEQIRYYSYPGKDLDQIKTAKNTYKICFHPSGSF